MEQDSTCTATSSATATPNSATPTALHAAARRSRPPNANNPFAAPFLLQHRSNHQFPSSSISTAQNRGGTAASSSGAQTNAKGKGKAVRFDSEESSIPAAASSSSEDDLLTHSLTHRPTLPATTTTTTTNGKGKGKAVARQPSSDDIELVGEFSSTPVPAAAASSSKARVRTPGSFGMGKWLAATESDLEILLDNPHFTSNLPPSSIDDDNDDDDEPLIFTQPPPKPIPSTSTSNPTASTSTSTSTTTAESLANLTCPICLGPPTPLAMTICGHAFCGGCLHESLASGPELTPPPEPNNAGLHRYGFGFGFGPGTGGAAGGGGAGRGSGGARRGGRMGGEGELDARCPVCRTILRGGWNKSLRGLIVRMAVVED